MKDVFKRRFVELDKDFGSIPITTSSHDSRRYVQDGKWEKWATSAQNLILAVFGDHSPHYKNFVKAYENCRGSEQRVKTLNAVFLSAKEDFEGGYVFDVDLRVSGEVFGDFVGLARQSLAEGYKDVAAVLACAALEDALKRYASANEINVTEKTMQDVVNALKASGLVAGAQKSLLDAMPRIRNMAMHADWGKLSEPDVSSVIGFVEQFLLSKFSHG
ncbi:MAG: DUF4145 domain-containing protein [Propionivibrio sp.]|uniref:DUF4145 domain-containing protein n=1 Tax=Propionivibrio sp. TaxID=2212460 RepID=UPI001A6276BD|nr:DUF4145 domain-containing protein [Propionivibrio sp.]MBL8415265.1 DUF4145 domain-containing protein [Propionivibrio sp.]